MVLDVIIAPYLWDALHPHRTMPEEQIRVILVK